MLLVIIECFTLSPVTDIVRVGNNPASIPVFTSMICDIFNIQSFNDIEIQWMLANGTYINSTTDRFTILSGNDNMDRNRTTLVITSLSYIDNGTYACQSRAAESSDSWTSANIEVVLLGEHNTTTIIVTHLYVLTR